MKYVIQIAGQKVLLDDTRMDEVVRALSGAETLSDVYVGTGKGDSGTDYSKQVKPYEADSMLSVTVMSDDYYGALVLKTKLAKDNQ